MPENLHEKENLPQRDEEPFKEKEKPDENGASSEDRKKRSYYYDDACGYEIYDADEEETDADQTSD